MKMLDGHRPKNVKLRQAGSGLRRHWDVEVVIRYDHMYLCRGWEQFYRAYNLRHGYFFLFRYDGDAMLTMKVYNTTMWMGKRWWEATTAGYALPHWSMTWKVSSSSRSYSIIPPGGRYIKGEISSSPSLYHSSAICYITA